MTTLDPPQQDRPAGAVRALLQAIHDYLDLPPVENWAEEPQRDVALQDRLAQVVGLLEVVLAGGSVEEAVEAVRASQARGLPFTPEPAALTAQRHATLAAHLARRSRLRLIGDRADCAADDTESV